jgi:hypothetical protein
MNPIASSRICRGRALALLVVALAPWSSQVRAASPFQYKKIVDTTTQVPTESQGVLYKRFGRPAINQSNVAYRAAFQNPGTTWKQEIERVTPNGSIILVQKANTAGPTTEMLTDPTIYGTSVAFGGLVTTGQGTAALYTLGNSVVSNGLANEEAPTIYDGKVVYPRREITTGSGPNNIHIAVTSGGSSSATVLVDQNTLVPGGGGQKFAQFDAYLDHSLNSSNNNGAVAFMGVWSSGVSSLGIYRWDQQTNSVTAIADKNVPIPGQSGTFDTINFPLPFITQISQFNNAIGNSFSIPQSFYDTSTLDVSSRPSLYGKTVSFNYDDGPRAGIYQRTAGPLTVVADINTPHTSLPGNFKNFYASSTVGGATAFMASDASGFENGIFLARCGQILEVATAGTVIDGKSVIAVDLGPRGLAVKQGSLFTAGLEIAFNAAFTDGTSAVYVASIPSFCISVSTAVSAGVGAGQSQQGTVFGSPSFTSPVFDDLTSTLRVEMHATAGPVAAVFGGSSAADVLAIDSLPGNDPTHIDFVSQDGVVIPEGIDMSFNEPLKIEMLHLKDFDANDSAILQVGAQSMQIDGAAYPDGMIPVADLLLAPGQTLSIGWDPANTQGNGFSLEGVLVSSVPEPSSVLLAAIAVIALGAYWVRARAH